MQPEPSVPQDVPQEQPVETPPVETPHVEPPHVEVPVAVPPKPARKFNFLALFSVILLLAVAGLGYWAWQLNTTLATTRQDLAALQEKYDQLTTDKDALSAELDETRTTLESELETTKGELADSQAALETANAELEDARKELTTLQERMKKASKWMDVAIASMVDGENDDSITKKVNALGDAKLKSMWKEVTDIEVKTDADFEKFVEKVIDFRRYLLESIADFLE